MARSNTYTVQRERRIEAPAALVREQIVDLRQWVSWSPWEDLDPQLRRTYGGPIAGVGAWYEWEGNRKAGEGRMEIVDVDESTITIDLQFVRPFRSRSTIAFVLEPDSGGTLVTWRMTGPYTFMTRIMGVFTSMDKMIGPDFERGLDRLKHEVEAGGGADPASA